MSNQYRITNIHAEILEHLMRDEGIIYHINDMSVLKSRIRYKKYDESAPIVNYIRSNGLELLPDDKENRKDIDPFNTISIRELINNQNDWKLSFFIQDFFYLKIKAGLDRIKNEKQFALFCNSCISELHSKEYYMDEIIETEGIHTNFDYVLKNDYISRCKQGAKDRWKVIKIGECEYPISEQQFILIDYVFEISELFNQIYKSYGSYFLESFRKITATIEDGIYGMQIIPK